MKPDELIAWLNERGADKPCPACDANDWIAETDELDSSSLRVLGPMSITKKETENGVKASVVSVYDAYMVSCKNCGFIRLHNKNIVEGAVNG